MPSPYQWPWIKASSTPTAAIDSTPTIIYGAPVTTLIDSILVANTSARDIFVVITLLAERDDVVTTTYVQPRFLLPINGSAILPAYLNTPNNPPLTLSNGDILYATSDFSNNTFDCLVSWRQLLETA